MLQDLEDLSLSRNVESMIPSLYVGYSPDVQQPSDDHARDDQLRTVHQQQHLAVKRQRDTRRKVGAIKFASRQSHLLFKLPQALQDLPVTVLLDLLTNLKRRAAQVADAETIEYMVCTIHSVPTSLSHRLTAVQATWHPAAHQPSARIAAHAT